MAGGTFETMNKVRAGVYIRFKSAKASGLSVGDRGTVAICEPLSWGPEGELITVEAGMDVTAVTGYDMTDSHNLFLQEIFRGSNRSAAAKKVLLYRPIATSAAAANASLGSLIATAKYKGTRGNDITIIITANAGTSDFTVSTVVGGVIYDTQIASTIAGLKNNDWVTFSGTGSLTANAGKALAGGSNGTVSAPAYSTFLTAIEAAKFDILCYDGTDTTVIAAFENFVKRMADDNGQYVQLVCATSSAPDSRFVINVASGVTLEDGTSLTAAQACWWVSGAQAGAKFNESLTFAKYPGAVAVSPVLTNSQIIEAINAGKFVLFADEGVVKVETDINSLTTETADISKVYKKNRVMRLCNTIANDIYAQFSENFIGVVNNNEVGRSRFKSAVVGYLLEIQAANGIQNFTADDVEVLEGPEIDAVIINIAIQAVDSAEKIYLTVEVA